MKMRKIIAIVLAMLMVLALGACDSKKDTQNNQTTATTSAGKDTTASGSEAKSNTASEEVREFAENPVVVLETTYGSMEIELYPDVAPITVTNFVKLVEDGFYDGLTFHRVMEGFMIQGGDPKGNGTGGSDTKIKGEFAANGVENNLSHERGVISMARSYDFDSASSQFFIMHADYPALDGQYAAFGRVLSGIEVVDAVVANSPVADNNGSVLPENQIEIVSIYLK